MLVDADAPSPVMSKRFRAMLVWMHEEPLELGRTYLAKHTTRTVRATARRIRYRLDVVTSERCDATAIAMNEIAEVEFETNLPLFFDPYSESRSLGSLILIDPINNATAGAAMIVADAEASEGILVQRRGFILHRDNPDEVERTLGALRQAGTPAVSVDDALIPEVSLPAVARALHLAGVTAVSARDLSDEVVQEIYASLEEVSL
jgi:bifunctional enzyme CysN/CysC/sulfate adenylyltransferase subunit 1